MKKHSALILWPILLSLSSCTYVWTKDFDNEKRYETARPPGGDWLASNRKQVVDEIVKAVRERHPTTAAWFPSLQVGRVTVATAEQSVRNMPEVERQLAGILGDISNSITPKREDVATWRVNARISFLAEKHEKGARSPVETAAFVGYAVFCWNSFLLVCPSGGEASAVNVDWTIETRPGEVMIVNSKGATSFVVSSAWVDNPDFLDPAIAKAFSAAIADFSDKLVTQLQEERSNR